jgi:hypothetical protein
MLKPIRTEIVTLDASTVLRRMAQADVLAAAHSYALMPNDATVSQLLYHSCRLRVLMRDEEKQGGPMLCPEHGGYGFVSNCTACKEGPAEA